LATSHHRPAPTRIAARSSKQGSRHLRQVWMQRDATFCITLRPERRGAPQLRGSLGRASIGLSLGDPEECRTCLQSPLLEMLLKSGCPGPSPPTRACQEVSVPSLGRRVDRATAWLTENRVSRGAQSGRPCVTPKAGTSPRWLAQGERPHPRLVGAVRSNESAD